MVILPVLCVPKLISLARTFSAGALALSLASFTLYFWGSALIIVWRMGR